jgi:zinc protease
MRTIQQRYYVPNNAALVVVGDVSADDVFARASALYASWARAPDPFARFSLVEHPPIRRSEVVLVQQPVETFTGIMAWQGPQTSDASVSQTYAADLLSSMANDPGSHFQRTLVDSGTCVSAHLGYWTQRNRGLSYVKIESTEAKIDACVTAVRDELPKLATAGYFSDEERANGAHSIAIDWAKQREHTDDYAHLITSMWTCASLDYYRGYVDAVGAVTPADLAAYLDRWVLHSPFVFSAMVSPKLSSSGMDQAHFEALVGITPKGAK